VEFSEYWTRIPDLCAINNLVNGNIYETHRDILERYDSTYKNMSLYFITPIYEELAQELSGHKWRRESVSVVMATIAKDIDNLLRAASSAMAQIGVDIELIISIDGNWAERKKTVEEAMRNDGIDMERVIFTGTDKISGVGQCRNQGLKLVNNELYTSLDDDDIFHPIRCLHAAIQLRKFNVDWLGTGYCRYSEREKKVYLVNGRLIWSGHNSFIAKSECLGRYGYLAPLERHEDTEYVRRLCKFGARLGEINLASHWLGTEIEDAYSSLSTDMRISSEKIEGHPLLCGSYESKLTEERLMINEYYDLLYQELLSNALTDHFRS